MLSIQPHRKYQSNHYFTRKVGETNYELTDHTSATLSTGLGNVRATLTDRKIATFDSNWDITGYTADIKSANDYFPFGSEMPGRSYNSGDYRYGFNGMEKDDEVKGSGNSYTTHFRQYDSRLGRWFSRDPVVHAWESPYTAMGNNPIAFNDPNGDKIKGDRKDRRAARKDMKKKGTWKDFKAEWGGKKKHITIKDTEKVQNSLSEAKIQAESLTGADGNSRQFWLFFNSNVDGADAGDLTGDLDRGETPTYMQPKGVRRLEIQSFSLNPILVPRPPHLMVFRPINLSVSTPFVAGYTDFVDPLEGMNMLRNVANTFLRSPNANEIIITIGTGTAADRLLLPSVNPDGRTVNRLLWDRGRSMRQALINMGVPVEAFPENYWLIFDPGSTIRTTMQVR